MGIRLASVPRDALGVGVDEEGEQEIEKLPSAGLISY